MKLLLLSDYEDPWLWDYFKPEKLEGIDAIISCGDLKAEYLSFLVTMGRGVPVYYVHGNHDEGYEKRPPEGCECIEGRLINLGGVRILGLGGCPAYKPGPHQYSERQMRRRIRRAAHQIRRAGGLDVLVSHAPPRGFGDGEDFAHRGFEAFLPLLDRERPRYLVHGHVHLNYGLGIPRIIQREDTTIINAWGRYVLEL